MIREALDELGIEVLLARRLTRVGESLAEFSDGTSIQTATTMWTGGMVASPLTACFDVQRDGLGRIRADRFLRVPQHPDVFVAGDTAAVAGPDGHVVPQSC